MLFPNGQVSHPSVGTIIAETLFPLPYNKMAIIELTSIFMLGTYLIKCYFVQIVVGKQLNIYIVHQQLNILYITKLS